MNKVNKTSGLFWFQHDLRLDDNEGLIKLANQVSELTCVYVVDPRWFKPAHHQSRHMGAFRWHFLKESLAQLEYSLATLGQSLAVIMGCPVTTLNDLLNQNKFTHFARNAHAGVYENQQWRRVQEQHPDTEFLEGAANLLFNAPQLPFAIEHLPAHFTPFRKQVEQLPINAPLPSPLRLPPPKVIKAEGLEALSIAELIEDKTNESIASPGFTGGAIEGQKQLQYFIFDHELIIEYKERRNGLILWDDSSKLSPWLALGCLSVKQVYASIKRFEEHRLSNESTYWLYFELLWREYFHWNLVKHQHELFRFSGMRQVSPNTSFWPERFAKWREGNTPYAIVNACMKQLNATGYMSNRGRQIVASCLVNELQLDWRFGAAYFEQQLVDFDVAVNWGNWQYLAGVGADPRGQRHFDLEKQRRLYDSNNQYIEFWNGHASKAPLDSNDAADWPIS